MRYTQTPTPSFTSTPSNTPTYTPTNTASSTSCIGVTPTPTPSVTSTQSVTPTGTPTRTPTPTPTPTTYPCVNCILYSVYNPNDEGSQELSYVPCGSINPITINVAGLEDIDVCACAGSLAYEGNLIVNQQGLCSPPPPTPTPSPTSNPCVVCRTYDIYNPSETTSCVISYIACGSSSYTTITVAPGLDTSICACTDSLAYECDLVVINSGACNPG